MMPNKWWHVQGSVTTLSASFRFLLPWMTFFLTNVNIIVGLPQLFIIRFILYYQGYQNELTMFLLNACQVKPIFNVDIIAIP